ncbi:hypothetical protein OOK31_06400 [Streptomyces sp. NBC_00249]|uniref:hypothetical protein n=1 Tax=Streptomyces sp. NBC_00249 TaxID=2975690 RepID=UPI00225712DC|nr:hypothetical protein [Streptomyces sp. NBC_00249]MCX5193524.1 hypothetical protein [Streptomyces sp. NBC_00249]
METPTALVIGQLTDYLRGLTQRLDPGAGWYGEFLRRDPDGMRACLEGAAVPPWDVVESLLGDLAGERDAVAREAAYAAGLRAAAVAAWDAMPGGAQELRTLLPAAAEQRARSQEALRSLTARLGGVGDPAEAAALNRELAWIRDDAARAGARHADLTARLSALPLPLPEPPSRPPLEPPSQWRPDPEPAQPPLPGVPRQREAPAGRAEGRWLRGARRRAGGARYAGAPEAPAPAAPPATTPLPVPRGARFPHPAPEATPAPPPGSETPTDALPGPWTAPPADGGPRAGAGPGPEGVGGAASAAPREATAAGPGPGGPAWHPAWQGAGADAERADDVGWFGGGGPEAAAGPGAGYEAVTGVGGSAGWGAGWQDAPDRPGGGGPDGGAVPGGLRGSGTAREAFVAVLLGLRAQGRSGEAHALLCEAAAWPADRLPGLADELARAGLAADWATLLWEAASLPPGRLAAAAAALGEAGREADSDRLLRQGVARPAAEVADAALALGGAGRDREALALLGAFVRLRTAEEAAALARRDPHWFAPRLLRAARDLSATRHRDLAHALRVAGIPAT